MPFYAGARISEIVALDVDDIADSARKGVLRIGSSAKANASATRSTRSCAAPSPAGWTNAPTGPAPTTAPRCFSTSAVSDVAGCLLGAGEQHVLDAPGSPVDRLGELGDGRKRAVLAPTSDIRDRLAVDG